MGFLRFAILALLLTACGGGTGGETDDTPDPPPTPSPTPPPVIVEPSPSDNVEEDPDVSDPGVIVNPPLPDLPDEIVVEDTTPEPVQPDPPDDETPPDDPPIPSPKIRFFTVTPSCITPGTRVTLSWHVVDANVVTLDGVSVPALGEKRVIVKTQKTFSLMAIHKGRKPVQRKSTVYLETLLPVDHLITEPFDQGEIDDLHASDDGTLVILSGDEIYLGTEGNFDRLTPRDLGSGWTAASIDPDDPDILYAARAGRVYRSQNGGESWPDVIPVRRNNRDLTVNTLHPSGDHLFIGFAGGAFQVNMEEPALDLMTGLNTEDIRMFGAEENRVVASDGSSFFSSLNQGGSWITLRRGDWDEIRSLEVHDGDYYASTDEGLFTYEENDWQKMGDLSSVHQARFIDGTLYAASDEGVFRFEEEEWINLFPEPAFRVYEDYQIKAASDSAFFSLETEWEYSGFCPAQPLTAFLDFMIMAF
ncbi:MAG: hypothetical protein Q7T11_06550 [Deltaproteobacteria bacterium]|nr:hypothetical protein [Deltaproteobacteria bacterium]